MAARQKIRKSERGVPCIELDGDVLRALGAGMGDELAISLIIARSGTEREVILRRVRYQQPTAAGSDESAEDAQEGYRVRKWESMRPRMSVGW